jgi:hypothetical protein
VLDPDGIAISTADNDQRHPAMVFGGAGHLVVWSDIRPDPVIYRDSDIYGARVDVSGTVLDPDGIVISTADNMQVDPAVAFDGENYLVIWGDARNSPPFNIYGARITVSGAVLDADGIKISAAASYGGYPTSLDVGFDGTDYFAVWQLATIGSRYDILGARVSVSGVVLDPDGFGISTSESNQQYPVIGAGSAGQLLIAYSSYTPPPTYGSHRTWGNLWKPARVPIVVDIQPGACPGRIDQRSQDVVRAAILGTMNLDVGDIDVESIRLEGVVPERIRIRDRFRSDCENAWGDRSDDDDDDASGRGGRDCAYRGVDFSDVCTRSCRGADGFDDMLLRFPSMDVLAALGQGSEVKGLTLTGRLSDGTRFAGSDCVVVRRAGRKDHDSDSDDSSARRVAERESVDDRIQTPSLDGAVPNPFNPVTWIRYALPREAFVTLSVFDVTGRRVERLVAGVRDPGEHVARFDAKELPSGIYFYRLEIGNFGKTRRMILLK